MNIMGRKLIGVNLIAIIIVVLLISILYGLSDAGFSRNLAAFLGKNFNVGFLAFFSLMEEIFSKNGIHEENFKKIVVYG